MVKKRVAQHGGVNIDRSTVRVGGDIVGGDKLTTRSLGPHDLARIERQFAAIYQLIEQRPADPDLDKAELKATVAQIEAEVKKGDAANPTKVERWLRFLAGMADDVAQVTIAALAHPVAGVAKAIQLIAKRADQGGL